MGALEGRPEGARAFRETLFLAMVVGEAAHHCQKSIFVAYDFLPLREQKIIRKGRILWRQPRHSQQRQP